MRAPIALERPGTATGARAPARTDPSKALSVASDSPLGALALQLLQRWSSQRGLLFVAAGERRAEHLGAILHGFAPRCNAMVLPRLDAGFDSVVPPSREVAGRRASVFRRIAEDPAAALVIASPEALMRRLPAPERWAGAVLRLHQGVALSPAKLKTFLEAAGYRLHERVDMAGTAAFPGQVIDLFPAGAVAPVRLHLRSGRIESIATYDPDSQRQIAEVGEVVLDPTSEELLGKAGKSGAGAATIFDYLPQAELLCDCGTDQRMDDLLQQVDELCDRSSNRPLQRSHFLARPDWTAGRERSVALPAEGDDERVPQFATERSPSKALRDYLAAQQAQKRRIVFAAAGERDLRLLQRRAGDIGARCATWEDVQKLEPGARGALLVDLERGFVSLSPNPVVVIAAADVLGSRATRAIPMHPTWRWSRDAQARLSPGDLVVHLQRGLGVLRGLETVSAPDLPDHDMVRLEFADDASVLIPVTELASVWRYGAESEGVALDKADGSSWVRRKLELDQQIAYSAARLFDLSAKRDQRSAPKLQPPAADYERFAARFAFVLTPDQSRAIEDVLGDLASGRPMDRLVCGDVGFGKTEIALRAAAAAVFSGKQVAVAVPTTVLARQHVETFRKRFAPFGIEVGHLSRFVPPAEAKAVKQGLADGSLKIVIGTHAIAAKGVAFQDLGLLVLDEEQRFGAAEKDKLAALSEGVHVLMLTATPIPRTLSLAAIGLRSLSVLATPPARRVPVKTIVEPFQDTVARELLRQEARRGGQSFVVCPRIADIEPMRQRLVALVPELDLRVLHGRMPGEAIDRTMVAFADGDGDVLLTTNIIESGLDLPRANTIIVSRPDRFGLAQLHQLRGRVGRGAVGAVAYFCTEPDTALTAAAQKRLKALSELCEPGAGFAISDRDLDIRGIGDLLGEDQAGHVSLVGTDLYRHLLERALAGLRGERQNDPLPPELRLEVSGTLPRSYIDDDQNRLELYGRIFKATSESDLDDLEEEIEERFGALPGTARDLILLGKINLGCKRLGVARIDAGPHGIAFTFARAATKAARQRAKSIKTAKWSDDRLVLARPSPAEQRIAAVAEALEQLDP